MESLVLTQLTIPEVRQLFRQELEIFFKSLPINPAPATDELLTVKQAAAFLSLGVGSIYGMVHKKEIPYSKPNGKNLYFSKRELQEWIKSGRKRTAIELAADASNYLRSNKKKGAR